MANESPDSKMPALVALGLVALGLVIALAVGITGGSFAGGIIAALGAIPACYGMWKGVQQQTQTSLAMALGALLFSLGVAAAMIIWAIIQFVR